MTRIMHLMQLSTLSPLLALLLLVAAPALAVSLGDELILSRLGDPVEIEIEVLQWEDMDLDRVQITAATREEYEVFELTWLPVLEELNFNLVGPDLDGGVRVLISSREPLNEPFLELLLVLRWPGGSLRREYVLLFDPPGTSVAAIPVPVSETLVMTVPQLSPIPAPLVQNPAASEPVAAVPPAAAAPPPVAPGHVEQTPVFVTSAAPVSAQPELVEELPANATVISVEEEIIRREVVDEELAESAAPEASAPRTVSDPDIPDARTQTAIEVETLAPQAPVVLDTTRRTYQVRSGDSLWNIARQFRPAGAGENLYQMLLSIHDLNRSSFVNGNIALLKANALLQIPSTADIDAIDALKAEAEFDRRWDQGTQRFEAVVRGEAIPLFPNDVPDEVVADTEEDLPPGTEAPMLANDEEALIMVSSSNAPQPLQITVTSNAANTVLDEAADVAVAVQQEPIALGVEPSRAIAPQPNSPSQTESLDAGTIAVPAVAAAPVTVQTQVRVITRAEFAAELETELAAMNTRRQSAEALAQQLQSSLEQAQAERATQASLLGAENLMLVGAAVLLLAALLTAGVFSLKIAGDLRLRNSRAIASLDARAEPAWMSAQSATPSSTAARKEPRMPEMEVIELQSMDVAQLANVAPRNGA